MVRNIPKNFCLHTCYCYDDPKVHIAQVIFLCVSTPICILGMMPVKSTFMEHFIVV